jgi:hypothetical protein
MGKEDRRPPRIRPAREVALVSLRCRAPLAQLAEQQTLNLRVRGSSPWRRTRDDLGLYRLQVFFLCLVCPDFLGVLAPCLLGGRMLAGGRLVKNGPIGLDQPSEAPPVRLRGGDNRRNGLAAVLSSVTVLPSEGLAPVQRTQSAPSSPATPPGYACLPVSDTGHGPCLQTGRRAAMPRSTKGAPEDICALAHQLPSP